MEVNTTYEPFAQDPGYISANRGLLEALPLDAIRDVVDLACGTGLLTDLLLELVPDLHVFGVDIDPEQIGIARRQFGERGLLVDSPAQLAASDGAAVAFSVGSADAVDAPDASFDLAMIGNAIHLMPDKPAFLDEASRLLRPGGLLAFNSVFYVGTFPEGSEAIYAEWMKQAVMVLNRLDAESRAAGKGGIPRQRGRHGRAFDKGWLSAEQWADLLGERGFDVLRVNHRSVPISREGLRLVGAYGGLSQVLMTGYPAEVASRALMEAVDPAFDSLGVSEAPRNWLEVTARKPG